MPRTPTEWLTAGTKSDGALAREILDHIRDPRIGYEDLVTVIATLPREQLWALSNHVQALGLAADHVSALMDNCRRAIDAAHEARDEALRDEAGDFTRG